MAGKASHSAGRFALEIGGKFAGLVKSVEYSSVDGDVAEQPTATDNYKSKYVANFKYAAAKCEISISQAGELWAWMKASMDKGAIAKDIALIIADFDGKAQNRIEMYQTHISEISLPAMGGDKKEAFCLTVGFQPAYIRFADGDGSKIQGSVSAKHKDFSTNNFEFELDHALFKNACARVSEIGALKWECKSAFDQIGAKNEFTQHYTSMNVGDLDVSFSMADAWDLQKAVDAWFVKGDRGESHHMTAQLRLLSAAMKEVGSITFKGLGIKKFSMDKATAFEDKIGKAKVQFYVEQFSFDKFEHD